MRTKKNNNNCDGRETNCDDILLPYFAPKFTLSDVTVFWVLWLDSDEDLFLRT